VNPDEDREDAPPKVQAEGAPDRYAEWESAIMDSFDRDKREPERQDCPRRPASMQREPAEQRQQQDLPGDGGVQRVPLGVEPEPQEGRLELLWRDEQQQPFHEPLGWGAHL
jgi:hypothetical protein